MSFFIAVIVVVAFVGFLKTVNELAARQQQEINALREKNNADLKASAEETRKQIDAVNTLLKDAIQKRAADVFMTEQEVAKMNADRVNPAGGGHRPEDPALQSAAQDPRRGREAAE